MGILCPISRLEDGLFEGFNVLSLRSKHETETVMFLEKRASD
jgi:hypothetical protein